ncbi:hypothetical protein FRC12_008068 [Ceratobasidium sp. 428]|nr:hypothetical protein FRC12_008068 [Ceratobasidium sp. 428]
MSLYAMIGHYMDMSEMWQSIQSSLPNYSKPGIAYNNMHDLSSNTSRPLLVELSPQEMTYITAKFDRINKMVSWTEQAAEELGVPILTNSVSIARFESQSDDKAQRRGKDEGEGEGEGEPSDNGDQLELWQQDRFLCKLCEQAQLWLNSHTFRFIPHIFAHLRDVHDISDPERGLDVTDRESIQNSPYLRLANKFEGLYWSRTTAMRHGAYGQ